MKKILLVSLLGALATSAYANTDYKATPSLASQVKNQQVFTQQSSSEAPAPQVTPQDLKNQPSLKENNIQAENSLISIPPHNPVLFTETYNGDTYSLTEKDLKGSQYMIKMVMTRGKTLLSESSMTTIAQKPFVMAIAEETPYLKSIQAVTDKDGQQSYSQEMGKVKSGIGFSGVLKAASDNNVVLDETFSWSKLTGLQKFCPVENQEQCFDLPTVNEYLDKRGLKLTLGEASVITLPVTLQPKRSFFDRLFGRNKDTVSVSITVTRI